MIKKILIPVAFFAIIITAVIGFTPPAHASSNSRLVDDSIFDNSSSMTASQINSWLNGFPSSCISPNSGFTAPDPTGYSPFYPYVDGKYSYGSPVTAGQVIYDVAVGEHINPQVLLTKLQNEEQLVDGTAGCDNWRYTSAVGYACTDSGTNTHNYTYTGADPYASGAASSYSLNDSTDLVTPLYYRNGVAVNSITGSCVNANVKAGFSEQVVHAAWLLSFSRHKSEGQTSWAAVGGNWNHCEDNDTCAASFNIPSSWACYSGFMTQGSFKRCPTDASTVPYDGYATIDGQSIHMDNGATAALYVYTPHIQSFPTIYSNWFGPPYADTIPLPVSAVSPDANPVGIGQPVTVTYTINNPLSTAVTLPSLGISNRMNGGFYDFGIMPNVTLASGETKTFSSTFIPTVPGTYSMRVSYYLNGQWNTGMEAQLVAKSPQLSVVTPINLSQEFPLVNQSYNISFTVKNTGDVNAELQYLMAANMSGSQAAGYSAAPQFLAPGQSYTYTASRSLSDTTAQKAWIAYYLSDGNWYSLGNTYTYRAYSTPADPKITSSLSLNPSFPIVNQQLTATFKVQNFGDQPIRFNNIGVGVIRSSDSSRFDFTSQPQGQPILLGSNQGYIYSATRTLPTSDNYNFFLTESSDGTTFGSLIPPNDASIQTSQTAYAYNSPADMRLSQPMASNTSSAVAGQQVTLSYQVQNFGDAPTGPVQVAFYCRYNGVGYCDIPGDSINLSNNQQHSINRTVSFTVSGSYQLQPLKYQSGIWSNFGTPISLTVNPYTPSSSDFTTTLNLSSTTVSVNTPVSATYSITNNTSHDLQIPVYAIAARLGSEFHDFGLQNWFFLNAGQTKTFTSSFTPTIAGSYKLFPVMQLNGTWIGYSNQWVNVTP